MSAPNEPAFDWSQAESLLGDDPQGVAEDMAAIVIELIESGNSHLLDLKKRDPATERKAIASLAHQLRGSLLNFGFCAVGGILLKIEKGDYADSEYQNLLDEAQMIFVQSIKMLGERYPSIKLA